MISINMKAPESYALKKLAKVLVGAGLAFPLWYITFLTSFFNSFWYRITLSIAFLVAYATFVDKGYMLHELRSIRLSHIGLGMISAVILYILFLVSFMVMKPIFEGGVEQVYMLKFEAEPESIAFILIFTSFGEEYFWRGFVQRGLARLYGRPLSISAVTATYSLIHIPTLNIPLMLAAFIAGLYWGIFYATTNSLWTVITSHMIWTELVFILLPLT